MWRDRHHGSQDLIRVDLQAGIVVSQEILFDQLDVNRGQREQDGTDGIQRPIGRNA